MKFVDMTCPKCGGSIRLNPTNKLAQCKYCGKEFVITEETTSRRERAFDLIAQRNYLAAQRLLNEVLALEPKSGEGYLGLLLCDLGIPTLYALAEVGFDYSNYPNYQRAVAFSDQERSQSLTQLCAANQAAMKEKTNRKTIRSDTVERFIKANTVETKDGNWSLIGLFLAVDFDSLSDKEAINVFHQYEKRMDAMIALYRDLREDEKQRIPYFDDMEAERAIEMFLEMKRIVAQEES